MKDILVLEGARTPFAVWKSGTTGEGKPGGALQALDPHDLAAASVAAAVERAGLAKDAVDYLVFANSFHAGAHGVYSGRYVTGRAGLPLTTLSHAVNLGCGAGLQAVASALDMVELGKARVAAACGADAPSQVPRSVFVPAFKDRSCDRHIAETAQDRAAERGVSRAEQDRWALESHRRACANKAKHMEEIVPLGGLDHDDAVRADASPELFAGAKPLSEGSNATHGNTHAIVDGGSAILLAEASAAGKAKARPLGRLVATAQVVLPPQDMALGSAEATRKVLSDRGLKLSDVDLFEINETFASQTVICIKELGVSEDRVNPNGGALAFGHPFAGSGCRQVLSLLKELKRRGLKRGVASVCVGGGAGVAALVETL